MIDALLGLVSSSSSDGDEATEAVEDTLGDQHRERNASKITYTICGHATLMSSWEDPNYFIGAFPILFPNGLGSHLDKRPIPVSLKAFAKWALNHYSRRYFFLLSNKINTLLTFSSDLPATRHLCTSFMMSCNLSSHP